MKNYYDKHVYNYEINPNNFSVLIIEQGNSNLEEKENPDACINLENKKIVSNETSSSFTNIFSNLKTQEKLLIPIEEEKGYFETNINKENVDENNNIDLEIKNTAGEQTSQSKPQLSDKENVENIPIIRSDQILDSKEESEIKIKLTPIQKLQTASDNYFKLRNKLNEISEDKNKKIITDKIATEINVMINQLSQMEDINNSSTKISIILQEFKKLNHTELYLYTIDLLLRRLIVKSENYKNEHKRNYLIFGKFVFELNKIVGNNMISDFFLQIISFKCPYISFKEFNKADFSDFKIYRKRLGFAGEDESMSNFFSNIESYSYLFFSYLFFSLKYYHSNESQTKYKHYLSNLLKYLEDFLKHFETCENKNIEYPHVIIYKVFLNCLGNVISKHIYDANEKIVEISKRIIKLMEEKKKNPKVSAEIKSLISDNLHFIRTYTKEVRERKITDMHR